MYKTPNCEANQYIHFYIIQKPFYKSVKIMVYQLKILEPLSIN